MPTSPLFRSWILAASRVIPVLLALALLALPGFAHASDSAVLRSLRFESADSQSERDEQGNRRSLTLHVRFHHPFQYRSHSPASRGSHIVLQLAPISPDARSEGTIRERLSLPKSAEAPAVQVTLEGDPHSSVSLTVELPGSMDFAVLPGADTHGIAISLSEQSSDDPNTRRARRLVKEARAAMTDGQIDRAILLYASVLAMPENELTPEALELMGVARERNQQRAHAVAHYRRYLEEYGDGAGAERVRQRLQALYTATSEPQTKLRAPRKKPRTSSFDFYGSASTYYSRAEIFPDVGEDRVLASSQLVSGFLAARLRTQSLHVRSLVTGTYRYDILRAKTGSGSRVSNLEIELAQPEGIWAALLGRQSPNGGGVLRRFDGLRVAYELSEHWELGLVGGLPVGSYGIHGVQTDQYFGGLNTRFSFLSGQLDGEIFGIAQGASGMLDRAALGGQIRYLTTRSNTVANLDVDVFFGKLNLARVISNWDITDRIGLNGMVERRSTPFLTTSNALIGSGTDSLEDLKRRFSDSEIRRLARDHTADSTTISLGGSLRFSDLLQLNGQFTASDYSGTDAYDNEDGTGFDFVYLIQLVASSLLFEGDVHRAGIRIFDADTSNRYGMFADARYRILGQLTLNPRLRADYRDNVLHPNQWLIRPGLRLDYRWKSLTFDAELTYEWNQIQSGLFSGSRHLYQLTTGLRYDF